MKKALHQSFELYENNGKILVWDFTLEEIVAAVNNPSENHHPVLMYMRSWMIRYYREGVTDKLLDDLNTMIEKISYSKIIAPSDLYSMESQRPQQIYVCRSQSIMNPEIYAANDFSKLLTNGELNRLKSCNLEGCEKIFLGRPQAKWCSSACGSKYRVRKKRKLDAQ
jgi:predicted RNA-binding Zn ribbon-like protein